MARTRSLRGSLRNSDPGTVYEAVDHAAANWSPAKGGLFRGIWVSVTGHVAIIDANGTSHTFSNVPVGMHPIGGQTVVTGTTTATVQRAVLDA